MSDRKIRISVAELRRLVYEAVHQAKSSRKWKEFKGQPPKDEDRLGTGMRRLKSLDLSKPPPGGGRMKRQGATFVAPGLNAEGRLRQVIRTVVREAMRRR